MTRPPIKPRIEGRVVHEVREHLERGAEREGVSFSSYLNLRLRQLRAIDLLLLRCDPKERDLVRIVQKHMMLHPRKDDHGSQ